VDLEDGQVAVLQRGLSKGVTGRVRIAQFNDPGTLGAALEPGDVALVLTEPAMTNNLHLLLPEPGWHQALRDLNRQHGTLRALDETHTHVVGPGGATAMWHLHPDLVTRPTASYSPAYANPARRSRSFSAVCFLGLSDSGGSLRPVFPCGGGVAWIPSGLETLGGSGTTF
jgi:hypothetical protein